MISTNRMGQSPPQPGKPSTPTMAEFTAFHGMVCNPISSKHCIDYFDGGALFASQADYDISGSNHLSSFDYTQTSIRLNLITYYLLVIFSCTGLLTVLGQTKTGLIREENVLFDKRCGSLADGEKPAVESESIQNISGTMPSSSSLVIPQKVIDYMMERSMALGPASRMRSAGASTSTGPIPSVRLIRRFEFEFGTLLSVIMCHFECHNGRRYLVEVYDFPRKDSLITQAISAVMGMARSFLHLLPRRRATTDHTKQC